MKEVEKEKKMSNLERLEKEKRDMIERHRRERQAMDDKILKEKEHFKRQKEYEKKQKDQHRQQNIQIAANDAYQNFVKDSKLSIAEINEMFKKFLNDK